MNCSSECNLSIKDLEVLLYWKNYFWNTSLYKWSFILWTLFLVNECSQFNVFLINMINYKRTIPLKSYYFPNVSYSGSVWKSCLWKQIFLLYTNSFLFSTKNYKCLNWQLITNLLDYFHVTAFNENKVIVEDKFIQIITYVVNK